MSAGPWNAAALRGRALLLVALALGAASGGAGCATSRPPAGVVPAGSSTLRERWGIEVASVRMSGNGHLVDFRYRVLDPAKAGILGDRKLTPALVDQATGARLRVPDTPKLGPLRQSPQRMKAGKIYYMLFANSGLTVKAGSQVTLEIGDFRAENLSVE
jgi:hypothetical protein